VRQPAVAFPVFRDIDATTNNSPPPPPPERKLMTLVDSNNTSLCNQIRLKSGEQLSSAQLKASDSKNHEISNFLWLFVSSFLNSGWDWGWGPSLELYGYIESSLCKQDRYEALQGPKAPKPSAHRFFRRSVQKSPLLEFYLGRKCQRLGNSVRVRVFQTRTALGN
jgi:hypothetical protein